MNSEQQTDLRYTILFKSYDHCSEEWENGKNAIPIKWGSAMALHNKKLGMGEEIDLHLN